MTEQARLWMRSEMRSTERRAPIVPEDASKLISCGFEVTVEESPQRIFPSSEYAAVGCTIAPAGSWVDAETDQYIVGLKELPASPGPLAHRHLYFGHAYKGQQGGAELLHRFSAGGGELLDLESLVDADGRRLTAFGFWAGYLGAALAVLHARGRLAVPLQPMSKSALDSALSASQETCRGAEPSMALVIGALGRCGGGARSALTLAGFAPTCWDIDETRNLDTEALLAHDILVNTVFCTDPVSPFLTTADLDDRARRLNLIVDVTCDVTSECNALPIYDTTTNWRQPVRRLRAGNRPLDIIAIDNLPSLLPAEASRDFSAQLLPQLMSLGTGTPVWQRCREAFRRACCSVGVDGNCDA